MTTTSETTVKYFDLFRSDDLEVTLPTADERRALLAISRRVPSLPTLDDVVDYVYETTRPLFPCDRLSISFIEENGRRHVTRYTRAAYWPVLLDRGYGDDLSGSLQPLLKTGSARVIGDLAAYLGERPASRSTKLLTREGVRSSLTAPISIDGHVVGFMFRSSRHPGVYNQHHVLLHVSIIEQIAYSIERAWRLEQLERANAAYFEMLGFVSHELKNPVASMVTDARLLADGYLGPLEEPQRAKLERLIHKGEYLLDLVREYLDLARVEGGELRLVPRSGVLFATEVLEPSLDLVRNRIDEHGMTLTTEFPDAETLTADCDPSLLKIVLVNLLGNAVQYGREGGSIKLTVGHHGRGLRISVWNEGPGFKPGERGKLFRKFSRLGTPGVSNRRGTGLGLYNAWRIVRLHGGRIRAESTAGEWAAITFDIPQPLRGDAAAQNNGAPS